MKTIFKDNTGLGVDVKGAKNVKLSPLIALGTWLHTFVFDRNRSKSLVAH